MNEAAKFEVYKKKLQGICDENNLAYHFYTKSYPITLVIQPLSSVGEQMSMLESVEDTGTYISPDASIVFSYRDGDISYKTSKIFTISDALFTKVKNLYKNMCLYWLQFFHRDLIERHTLTARTMPVIDEQEADDMDLQEDITESDEEEIDASSPLVQHAISIVRMENKATTALLQRRLGLDIAHAKQLMDKLEELGVVGPFNAAEPREVLAYDEPEDAGT
jgi:hypothetical protein